jgi:hypothetical protein
MKSLKLIARAGGCCLLLLAGVAHAEAASSKPITIAPAKKTHAIKAERKPPAHGHKRPATHDSSLDHPQLG